ncbi:hypothetical protein [Muricoccus pecuniae]|uniref:Uncharacterized protein n=1 Tax=Muricoccus pecuniae TaxID=693023 RepID=A0A840Y4Z5_9PROT|nr:hypothetical protein [Roseomonas pecuniae]MBB5693849.1 hypothetical protein [Roseomonas pecuniae]
MDGSSTSSARGTGQGASAGPAPAPHGVRRGRARGGRGGGPDLRRAAPRGGSEGSGVPTNEKALRGGDGSFAGLLLIEATDEAALHGALARYERAIAALGAEEDGPATYSPVFMLRANPGEAAG